PLPVSDLPGAQPAVCPFLRVPQGRLPAGGGRDRCAVQRPVRGLHLLRSGRGTSQPGSLRHPLADRRGRASGASRCLSGVLDQELPQDELQDRVPADRAADEPALGVSDLRLGVAGHFRAQCTPLYAGLHRLNRLFMNTEGTTACRKKTAWKWKALSSTPSPTPCFAWSWRTGMSLPRTSPGRCARTTSAS